MFGFWLIWVSVCPMGGFRFASFVVAWVSVYAVDGFWFVSCVVACVSVCAVCGVACVSVCVAFVGFNLRCVWVLVCVVGGLQFFWDVSWVVALANSAELWPWLVR